MTDTSRTATEQLLLSDSMERAVQQIHFSPLAGKSVYLDETYLSGVVDRSYLVSTLRQHMLASGCVLANTRDAADYVVEARSGAVGTNNHKLLFGIPAVNMPSFLPVPIGVPTSIPEVPIVKRTDRRGVTKLAVFAYHRETGAPVWQSGVAKGHSTAQDIWVLGAGPFQRGTIHEGLEFAGGSLPNPLPKKHEKNSPERPTVAIQEPMLFEGTAILPEAVQTPILQASATEPDKPAKNKDDPTPKVSSAAAAAAE